MFVVPVTTPVASPVPLTVATPVFDDDHVATPVRTCVLPLLYVPVATYCCVVFGAIVMPPGLTAIETSVAVMTVSPVEPLTAPRVAEIDVVPVVEVPVTTPLALTVATPVFEDAHVTDPVMLAVVPFE
jgi:hypothetical protein